MSSTKASPNIRTHTVWSSLFSLAKKINSTSCYKHTFNILASLFRWSGWFEPYLSADPALADPEKFIRQRGFWQCFLIISVFQNISKETCSHCDFPGKLDPLSPSGSAPYSEDMFSCNWAYIILLKDNALAEWQISSIHISGLIWPILFLR